MSDFEWSGRDDGVNEERFFQIIKHYDQNLNADQKIKTGLLGFASDVGVLRNKGRAGAKQGPTAIRKALANLCIHEALHIADFGDVIVDQDLEAGQKSLCDQLQAFYQKGIFPLVIGGGHETGWPHAQAIMAHHSKAKIAIVNFDAHFDLRELLPGGLGSSGTPFLQVLNLARQKAMDVSYTCIGIQPNANSKTIFDRAIQEQVKFCTAEEMMRDPSVAEQLLSEIAHDVDVIYVSICLDVLAQAYAPGVSAPQAMGLSPTQLLPLVEFVCQTDKIVGFDVVELAPCFDRDAQTAKLAAYFALLGLKALAS